VFEKKKTIEMREVGRKGSSDEQSTNSADEEWSGGFGQ